MTASNTRTHLLVISGTNRPGSNTRLVAQHTLELLTKAAGSDSKRFDIQLLDLAELSPDIFSPGSYAQKPAWFEERFQRAISNAAGILVVTPEYNGSFPGVLKYFIDMLRFPESLVGVPSGFIGLSNGLFGALRAVEQLEMIFGYRSAHLFGERLFIPKIGAVIHQDGSVGEYEERLAKLVRHFHHFVATFVPAP